MNDVSTTAGPEPAPREDEEQRDSGVEAKRRESLGSLLAELTDETRELFRNEVELAKTETREKVSDLSEHATRMALGGGIALTGFILLMSAVNLGLTALFSQFIDLQVALWLAPLLLAVVLMGIGWALVHAGRRELRQMSIVPEQTTESLREHGDWLKEKVTT